MKKFMRLDYFLIRQIKSSLLTLQRITYWLNHIGKRWKQTTEVI
jgi:hypothetical protein